MATWRLPNRRRRHGATRAGEGPPPLRKVRADFYGPVPDLEALDDAVWTRRSPMEGIRFDVEAQLAFAEGELAGHLAAFAEPEGFTLDNRYYESVDAEMCDAIVRWLQPARVVEIGCGWSTLLLRAAAPGAVESYDPYPPDFLDGVHPVYAQAIPVEVVDELEAGDVLFVDSSHTVKTGGDVNRIVLDLLPRLRPGVVVHFHDIWLPFEYHRFLLEGMGMFWTEQYLLQAFLIGNRDWEVIFGAQAVARDHPARLKAMVRSFTGETYPSAFWMRHTG